MTNNADEPSDYDRDAVIERLLNEQAQTGRLINDLKKEMSSHPEFHDLSLRGGIKTIIRRFQEEQDKNRKLEKELRRMTVTTGK